jgi:septal ring factor EnvC (AmiA/AmiB activator)
MKLDWPTILAAASAIVLLSNAVEKIVKAVKAAKAPEQRQNDEINEIKKRLDSVEKELSRDEKHLKDVRECNHVITKGVLALLDHGINGNNIDQMKDARHDVETYLINH